MSSVLDNDKNYFKKYLSASDFIEIEIASGDKSV